MGAIFRPDERKDRPGVYSRYEKDGTPIEVEAINGVCAAVIRANGGLVGEVKRLESIKDIEYFAAKDGSGEGSGVDSTDILREMFYGGARSIYAVRVDNTADEEAYEEAFDKLKPFRWNVIGVDVDVSDDTENKAIQDSLVKFVNKTYEDGNFVMGVIGVPTFIMEGEERVEVPFGERLEHIKGINDYKIVYVGSGFVGRAGETRQGCLAAARVAGMIAATPSNESITHMPITGAVELTENLDNSKQVEAINGGMLTFSVSPGGTCWIECGVNTFIAKDTDDDQGWQKIKRTKIRFELMQRINDTVENLVGRINNDADGRATIIQAAQGVCNSMVNERKLLAGAAVVLDESNPPKGESAWFLVFADDIDSLEKMYFTFKFRFVTEEESSSGDTQS